MVYESLRPTLWAGSLDTIMTRKRHSPSKLYAS